MVVVEPSGKAFDAAFGLRPIGHFRGDVGQLRAFAAHDAADERRQGGEVAGEVACGRSRIGLREGVADGMIARSEEHTSELQPQSNLVCRLLLEKKKTRIDSNMTFAHVTLNALPYSALYAAAYSTTIISTVLIAHIVHLIDCIHYHESWRAYLRE